MFIEKRNRLDIPCNENKKFDMVEKDLFDRGKNDLKNNIIKAIACEKALIEYKPLVNKIFSSKNFSISIETKNKLLELSDETNYNKMINSYFMLPYEICRDISFFR